MKGLSAYIVIFIFTCFYHLQAQVFEPFGTGLNRTCLAVAQADGKQMYALTTTSDSLFQLGFWDGSTWTFLKPLATNEKAGTSTAGEHKLCGMVWYNGKVYLATSYKANGDNFWQNRVFQFYNEIWTNTTNSLLENATLIYKLLIYNGSLVAIVKNTKDTPANIFYFDNNEWVARGNYLTPDVSRDDIEDAFSYNGRIYMSGVFTKIGSADKRYLAEWDGNSWSFVNFPPFVQQSYLFGAYGNNMVLYGQPASGSDYIKVYDKTAWQTLSTGLSNISINKLSSFAYSGDMLWACGDFKSNVTSRRASLMYYLPSSGWVVADTGVFKPLLHLAQYGSKSILYGDFTSFYKQPLNHIAELSAFTAMLRGSVYDDADKNCMRGTSEVKKAGTGLLLNPGNHYFVTNSKGEFSIPVLEGKYTLKAVAPKNWEVKCSDISVNVTINNTIYDIELPLSAIANITDGKISFYDFGGWKVDVNKPNAYRVCASNVGTTAIAKGKLIVFIPREAENLVFTPTPDYVDTSRAEWLLSNLAPGAEVCVDIVAGIRAGVAPDIKLSFRSSLQIDGAADNDANDNIDDLNVTTAFQTASNGKASSKTGNITNADEPLHYRILFQNTGTGLIQNLKIVDTLDDDIYLSAKGIYESTSHPSTLDYKYILTPKGNYQYILTWNFENLNLKDSLSDNLKSRGFSDIKVYTDNRYMKKDAVVCNRALLYFENKEPVVTNTVCNNLITTGIYTPVFKSVGIYPNPAAQQLQVNVNTNDIFTIVDLQGKTVLLGLLADGSNLVDVSNLKNGIYVLVTGKQGAARFVVNR